MAEALGVAASIVGMVSHLQSVAMALTEIQRRTRTIAKTEQEYFLRLERSMQRATLLLGTIQMLDVSATSNQEPPDPHRACRAVLTEQQTRHQKSAEHKKQLDA